MPNEVTNFPRETTMREIANALNVMAIAQANGADTTAAWPAVQQLVRQGLGRKAYPVGTQLAVSHSEYGSLLMDVVAHNHHKKPGDADAPTMTLLMHHCIYGRMIDNSEMLWINTGTEPLPAGTQNFTLLQGAYDGSTSEDSTYQFITTQAIPAGGGFRHTTISVYHSASDGYKKANVLGGTFTTYDANGTVIESGLATTEGSAGTSLGTASRNKADTVDTVGRFNCTQRNAYGSNNNGESAARQWLNSGAAANAWWKKQTPFDLKPAYADKAGFLNGIDPDFAKILGPMDITVTRNTIYEEGDTLGGSYTQQDKLFLPSMAELGLGNNNSIAEGSTLEFYDGATQTDRIKYDQAAQKTARYWWLRSPYPSSGGLVRFVYPSGALSYYYAYGGYGLAAACVIY